MMSETNLYHCTKCDYSGNRPLMRCPNCNAFDSLTTAKEQPRIDANAFLLCPYCQSSYQQTSPRCPSCGASSPLTVKVQTGEPGTTRPATPKAKTLPTVKTIAKASGCATALKIIFIGFAALAVLFFLIICVIALIKTMTSSPTPEPSGALLRYMAAALQL